MEKALLQCVRTHSGASTSEITEIMIQQQAFSQTQSSLIDWVIIRQHLDALCANGKLRSQEIRGITRFYTTGNPP